jgi:hypothetical protein
MKKIKVKVEKKHAKKVEKEVVEQSPEDMESLKVFNEMKKLPFSE